MPPGPAEFSYRWRNTFDGSPVADDGHAEGLEDRDSVASAHPPHFPLDDVDGSDGARPPDVPRGIPPAPVPDGVIDPIQWRARNTGHPRGEDATEETIRQGTGRMEEHPDFYDLLDHMRDAGFDVR